MGSRLVWWVRGVGKGRVQGDGECRVRVRVRVRVREGCGLTGGNLEGSGLRAGDWRKGVSWGFRFLLRWGWIW
jgi:hypothetical protein